MVRTTIVKDESEEKDEDNNDERDDIRTRKIVFCCLFEFCLTRS
jgi:hypothetical protein